MNLQALTVRIIFASNVTTTTISAMKNRNVWKVAWRIVRFTTEILMYAQSVRIDTTFLVVPVKPTRILFTVHSIRIPRKTFVRVVTKRPSNLKFRIFVSPLTQLNSVMSMRQLTLVKLAKMVIWLMFPRLVTKSQVRNFVYRKMELIALNVYQVRSFKMVFVWVPLDRLLTIVMIIMLMDWSITPNYNVPIVRRRVFLLIIRIISYVTRKISWKVSLEEFWTPTV